MTDSTPNDLGKDAKFRENVRRQLMARDAEGTQNDMDIYEPMVQMDPAEGRAVRWFGAVIGSALFVSGAFWFLAILGFYFPWYTIFPVAAMFVGGFFVTAAYATKKDLKKRKS